MVGLLISLGIFVFIVALVSYVVSESIEDEKEFDRWLSAENEEIDQL